MEEQEEEEEDKKEEAMRRLLRGKWERGESGRSGHAAAP